MAEKSRLDTPQRMKRSPQRRTQQIRRTTSHFSIKDVGSPLLDGWVAQLTPEGLGCVSHTEKLLRQRIHVAYLAREILEPVRLVGEQSLLLVI